jgi:3-mercaptopyruvate sulfurtransferase SseA
MKKLFLYFIIVILLYGNTFATFAMERFDVVTTQQLKQMLDDRSLKKTDFILVNSLDEIIFGDSSIPGSINIPWSQINAMSSKLGKDKDKLIIIY